MKKSSPIFFTNVQIVLSRYGINLKPKVYCLNIVVKFEEKM